MRQLFIGLDPGHGSFDTGLVTKDRKESDITLLIVQTLVSMIPEHTFFLTRTEDVYVTLEDRVKRLVINKTDFNLTFHTEYNANQSYRYGLCLYHPKGNLKITDITSMLRDGMYRRYQEKIGKEDSNFFMIRKTRDTILIRAPYLLTTYNLLRDIDTLCFSIKCGLNYISEKLNDR